METRKPVGFTLLKIASIYMMAALLLGLFMGMTHSFSLISVHSHIGLLGWLTMAVAGLVYVVVPRCDGNRLSKAHFWLHNVGLPVMVSSLAWNQYGGGAQAETIVGISSMLVMIALLLFTLNLFINCRRA